MGCQCRRSSNQDSNGMALPRSWGWPTTKPRSRSAETAFTSRGSRHRKNKDRLVHAPRNAVSIRCPGNLVAQSVKMAASFAWWRTTSCVWPALTRRRCSLFLGVGENRTRVLTLQPTFAQVSLSLPANHSAASRRGAPFPDHSLTIPRALQIGCSLWCGVRNAGRLSGSPLPFLPKSSCSCPPAHKDRVELCHVTSRRAHASPLTAGHDQSRF